MRRGMAWRSWDNLRPFLPPMSQLRIVGLGAASFVGGMAESLVLVLLTLTADSLIRQAPGVEVLGVQLTQREAVLLALVLVTARVVMTLAASASSAKFSTQTMAAAQSRIVAAYLRGSHTVRTSRPPGDLGAVAVNHGRLIGDLANSFTIVAASACGLLAFGGTSLSVNPLATVGIAGIGGLVLASMRPLRTRSRAASNEYATSARSISQDVAEIESLHREIEVLNVSEPVLRRVDAQIYAGAATFERLRFLGTAIPQLFQAALLAAAVVSLLIIVNNVGDANLAEVGAVVLLLIRSMSSAQQLVTANQRVVEFGAYATNVSQFIETMSATPNEFGTERPDRLAPVRLDRVGFSYDGSTNVLNDLEIQLNEGDLIGIVGPSGAGKSTLVELMLRLRRPTTGSISCDGTPLDQIDPAEFARRVAFVPQQSVLIAGTIAENIDLFRGLPEDRIRAAIKQAHLEADVEALPNGIHTRLGPDDRSLSGGQQQRLTIARALAADPEILVLDEPTSALDAVSEKAIRETLSELPAGRVVIVVAHRFSTLRSCNRILVIQDGRVEMDATPDEVAERSAFFRTMVDDGH